MPVDILLTVIITSIVQSIFGAGVLLFGTPLLLLFGRAFIDVLVILLPISITINLLQIVRHHAAIDHGFYRQVLLLTLPPIILCLLLVTRARINIGLVIGTFLLIIAMKDMSLAVARSIARLMAYQRIYFIVMGVVHGLSNLGGSLLTALVHHRNYPKDVARVTIAASYATFAAVQLLTLWVFRRQDIDVPFADNAVYLIVGALIFVLTDEILYAQIEQARYRFIFSGFLMFSGLLLLAKSLV